MPQFIDLEVWEPLHSQANKVYGYVNDLETYSRLDTQPPVALLDDYNAGFQKLIEIIGETREQCAMVGILLSHDVFNYLAPLQNAAVKIRLKRYKEAWEKLRSNICVNLIVKNVIDALKFYVDGVLEVEDVVVADFLLEIKPSLECVFYDFGKYQKERKLRFLIHNHMKAAMHPGTLANLLQNICLNSQKHGGASRVVIKVKNNKDRVRIIVLDDGKGIDPLSGNENCDDIFKPGISRSGSKGIGLSYAREKMHLMGGNILCFGHGGIRNKKTHSKGARFEIVLSSIKTSSEKNEAIPG